MPRKPDVQQAPFAATHPSANRPWPGRVRRVGKWCGLLAMSVSLLVGMAGCNVGQPDNPSFPLDVDEAWQALDAMAESPKAPERLIVVCGGWRGGRLEDLATCKKLLQAVGEDNVVFVTFGDVGSFSEARTRLIEAVAERVESQPESLGVARVDAASETTDVGSSSPWAWTAEVDVIGISMGGLVARDAACPPRPEIDDPRRLRIATLYGISVPHRGLALGGLGPDPMAQAMNKGTDTHARIQAYYRPGVYNIEDYARLGDVWVGAKKAQMPGHSIHWLPNRFFADAHLGFNDPRIMADIVRRLRGETPFTTEPAAPLP